MGNDMVTSFCYNLLLARHLAISDNYTLSFKFYWDVSKVISYSSKTEISCTISAWFLLNYGING
ncbi:hypothetical protein Sjap_010831 [Stephania japonica]|uniref:Uncharacterized protein n=1 Tax=Stephania japonica TaxID=461633 RepID=A0AAP0P4X7_9MAGN